jgi:hypothetical protein
MYGSSALRWRSPCVQTSNGRSRTPVSPMEEEPMANRESPEPMDVREADDLDT